MENFTIYEIILKTQCDSYNQILYLLDRIARCDDGLLFESSKDTPSVSRINDFTYHKSSLIAEIDKLSSSIEQNQIKLLGVMSLITNAQAHPLWERLIILREMVKRKIDRVIFEEDKNNSLLCDRLTSYKERLELDIAISKVPKEKRKIFFINPNS